MVSIHSHMDTSLQVLSGVCSASFVSSVSTGTVIFSQIPDNSRAAGTMPPSSSLKPACQVVPSTASGHARFQVVCELPVTHDQLALESLYYLEISTLRPEESRM